MLERLRKDELRLLQELPDAQLPDSTAGIKQLADRKLLSLTGKAVDVLEEVMDSGAPKERLAASVAILDHSPATQQQKAVQQQESLPMEALELLMNGIGKMFSTVIEHKPSEIKLAERFDQAPEALPEARSAPQAPASLPAPAKKPRGRPKNAQNP